MPNWVRNILRCDCSDEQWTQLREAVKSDESVFSFNSIIPRPQGLDVDDSGRGKNGERYYRQFLDETEGLTDSDSIYAIRDRIKAECDADSRADWELGRQYVKNEILYGFPTWYGWSNQCWGTKWDACDAEVDNEKQEFVFDTAYGAPLPVVCELVKRFPDITFTLVYADNDIGHNCGQITFARGNPDRCDKATFASWKDAVVFACGVWDYDPDEYLSDEDEDEDE